MSGTVIALYPKLISVTSPICQLTRRRPYDKMHINTHFAKETS